MTIAHITHGLAPKVGRESYCGKNIIGQWHFQNIDHALLNQGVIVPCPDCLAAILAKVVLSMAGLQGSSPGEEKE